MVSICIATALTFITMVLGHECKDYNLSPSDQSLIDMIKHYLHTSREASFSKKQQDVAVTYVRWGKKSCPVDAEVIYTGQAGGNQYNHKGGGVNYLCLPNDPENGQTYNYANDVLFGAEYQVEGVLKPSLLPTNLHDQEVPCVVCKRKEKSSVLMIPGRKTCYNGWKLEYNGLLMTERIDQSYKEYACVDVNAEVLDNKLTGNEDGALFFTVRTKCGSLKCPPYTDSAEVNCVVCTN